MAIDLDGDGIAERTGWIESDDGFLALDANGRVSRCVMVTCGHYVDCCMIHDNRASNDNLLFPLEKAE